MLLLFFPSKIIDIRIIPEMDFVMYEENNHLLLNLMLLFF